MKNVLVAGGGTLGSQIAYQSAYFGKQVTVYDVSDAAITAAEKRRLMVGMPVIVQICMLLTIRSRRLMLI